MDKIEDAIDGLRAEITKTNLRVEPIKGRLKMLEDGMRAVEGDIFAIKVAIHELNSRTL